MIQLVLRTCLRTCACACAYAFMRMHLRTWVYLCVVVPSSLVVHATPCVASWHRVPCHAYAVFRMGCLVLALAGQGISFPRLTSFLFMFNRGRLAENLSKDGCCFFVCCCSGWGMACGIPLLTSFGSEWAHAPV